MLGASRYFVAYSFDTTLGVAATVGIHTLILRLCSSRAALFPHIENHWCRCIAECGKYGALAILLICITPSKVLIAWSQLLKIILARPRTVSHARF